MADQIKRTIILMRHAKSSWSYPHLRDFDRPLNQRGKNDAPRMGAWLKGLGIKPKRIVSSPAARAKATIQKVLDAMGLPEDLVEWDENLYFTGAKSYVDAIRKTDDQLESVMTVGHNPMTDEAISLLSKTPVHKNIVTATIACLEVNLSSWKDLEYGTCEIKWITSPKEI
ncbi:MAG: histidine phosphatase family protein [Balneolaceae bacterium]|nr:MAG: histidine phosphatase family protein [Balneolaceae bacterium]